MSLVTDPRAVIIATDGDTSSDDDDYYDTRFNSSRSSVDELVHRAFHGRYTTLERDLESAQSALKARGGFYRHHSQHIISTRSPSPLSPHDVEEDARYVERLQQRLMRLRVSSKESQEAAKPRRRPVDSAAFERLTKPNTSTAAKQQEKYEKRLERERLAAQRRQAPSVSPVATAAGARLYTQAKGLQKSLRQMQEQAEGEREKELDSACTFKPQITALAQRMSEEGYQSIEERMQVRQAQEEERQRRRLELQAEHVESFPFKPTISSGSRRIMSAHRQSHSRSRSRSQSRQKRAHSVDAATTPPPTSTTAGERLYRDGGERLLRQQIRRRLAAQEKEARVVGNPIRLSQGDIASVTNRLGAWQQARDRHVEEMRAEAEKAFERQHTLRDPNACVGVIERPRRGTTSSAAAASSRSSAGSHRGSTNTTARRASSVPRPQKVSLKGGAGHREESPPVSVTVSVMSSSSDDENAAAPPGPSAGHEALYREMRLIRFGALFYKYTPDMRATTVTLADVKHLIRKMYPEDTGVAVALTAHFAKDDDPISKEAFIHALATYEQQHGPQPWGRTEKDALLFPQPVQRKLSTSSHASQPAHTKHQQGETRASSAARSGSAPPAVTAQKKAKKTPSAAVCGGEALSRMSSPAAVVVPGFTQHVERARSSSTVRRSASVATHSERDECTFHPKLRKRTIELSKVEKERRLSYAMELQLRRKELELLHVLTAGDASPSPSPSSRKQVPATTTKTPSQPREPKDAAARGGSVQSAATHTALGLSPSVELSSLSSEGSRPTTDVAVSPPPRPRAIGACHPAATELEALLASGDAKPVAGQRTTVVHAVVSKTTSRVIRKGKKTDDATTHTKGTRPRSTTDTEEMDRVLAEMYRKTSAKK